MRNKKDFPPPSEKPFKIIIMKKETIGSILADALTYIMLDLS